jgi:amino acid adenylation domain-containing protein
MSFNCIDDRQKARMEYNYNLASPFYKSACRFPERLAIWADGRQFSYSDVLQEVSRVAGWMGSQGAQPKRVGILASRSSDACIGILAAAWVGAAYFPINLSLPEAAVIAILNRSGLDALVADETGSKMLSTNLLDACPSMVLARRAHVPSAAGSRIIDFDELAAPERFTEPALVEIDASGYVIHTSGSTGIPKGVDYPAGAVDHLWRALDEDYPLSEEDRAAETSATSFDISVYNMFSTWRAGASLHIIPANQVMAPAKFIQKHQLTVWYSVPSIASFMARLGLLKPGAFPTLRQSFFAGEPLLTSVAAAWQVAAPSSRISNMYGPTEAQMCMGEDYGPGCAITRDCVSIGRPYPGMKAAVASPELKWVADGVDGELLLAGPQLALGYLDDQEKTHRSYVVIDGERWYRTGDLAHKDGNGVFHYLGRIDHQVKVLGYRVELGEIESHLREVTNCNTVVALAWPLVDSSATGIVAFHCAPEITREAIREEMKKRVPDYMVPLRVHRLNEMPLGSTGKIDRQGLLQMLDQGKV